MIGEYFQHDVTYRLDLPDYEAQLTLGVQNVLDERHTEIVGAPELGRYFLMRLRVGW